MKPHINRDKMQTITVRAGHLIRLDVDVKGEPPPKLTWLLCDKPLENSPTLKIENEDYNTKLQIRETSRKDTGKYLLRAENENGKDEAYVEINVLDKPSKPSDLEVTDIHKNGCKLKWTKPKGKAFFQ